MIRFNEIRGYLRSEGITAPIFTAAEEVRTQAACVILSSLPGLASDEDLTFDRPGVQVTIRGKQSDVASAEDLAMAVDRVLMQDQSFELASRWVLGVQQVSGSPADAGTDASKRTFLQASYLFEISR